MSGRVMRMKASEHPDFELEMAYLRRVRQSIDSEVENFNNRESPMAYSDPRSTAAWMSFAGERVGLLLAVRAEPFFGRVDFVRHGRAETEPLYFGNCDITSGGERQVIDWRSPVAQLYYGAGFRNTYYKAPGGEIRGDISLRRSYSYMTGHMRGELAEIFDERPTGVGELIESTQSPQEPVRDASNSPPTHDEYLHKVLAERRGSKLRDFVATIQAEQDAIIRTPASTVVVVQGAAGSGKTSVALHRIAYLLYAFRDTIKPERVMVFGPNRLFLDSISDVLPSLGVHKVKQATFDEWISRWVGKDFNVESHVELLERLVSQGDEHETNAILFRRSRLLGSMKARDLIREYARYLRMLPQRGAKPIHITYELPRDEVTGQKIREYGYPRPGHVIELDLSRDAVRELHQQVVSDRSRARAPVQEDRDHFVSVAISELFERLSSSLRGRGTWGTPSREQATERHAHFARTATPMIDKHLASWWPHKDAASQTATQLWRTLIAGGEALQAVTTALLSQPGTAWTTQDAELITASSSRYTGAESPLEDAPCIAFLRMLLKGRAGQESFDHIVVDEAQDISPMELMVLAHHAPPGGLTLVGDMSQGVYSYRGVQKWSELEQSLSPQTVQHTDMRISYRSTFEIAALANRILCHPHIAKLGVSPAIPLARHGREVNFRQFSAWGAITQAAAITILTATARGSKPGAILCKTAADCEAVYRSLAANDRDNLALITSRDAAIPDKPVIVPSYLAKGLEFDSVVIFGADGDRYCEREYDLKLLYVAVTRALHELHIFWTGRLAPALVDH